MEYFKTSNGIPVHISDSEKGERTIIFLHGYLETLYIWEEFRDLLPDSFRFISIDLPGHGLSGTHPESNTMEFNADVIAGILDKLSIESAILVGHSMGGYVAQAFLKKYPDRTDAIIHLNSNVHSDDSTKKDQRLKEIHFIQNGKLTTLAQIAIPNMFAKENLPLCSEKIEESIELCDTHDPEGISAVVRGLMDRPDNLEFLKGVTKPIMFVFGDSDSYTSVNMAKQILSEIPQAKGYFIASSGHNSFIEHPQQTADILIEFLKENSLI